MFKLCKVDIVIMICLIIASSPAFAAGFWSNGEDMPTSRSELAATHINNNIYVAGGLRALGATDAFEVYDTESNHWQQLQSLPIPLHHHALAALNGYVYVTGGYKTLDFKDINQQAWRYDPKTNTWTEIANLPALRAAHTMLSANGKLFVIGGVGVDPRVIFQYEPQQNHWQKLSTLLPTAREHLAAVKHKGKLYIMGGRNHHQQNLSVVDIYDLKHQKWSKGKPMPNARSGFTAAVINDSIHVIGGETIATEKVISSHESYNPVSNSWQSQVNSPTSHHGLASVAYQKKWYLFGGATRAGLYTLFSFSDEVSIYHP